MLQNKIIHMFDALLPISQTLPLNPAAQTHANPPERLMQIPAC